MAHVLCLLHARFASALPAAAARRLIPIRQTEWLQVHEDLLPGTEVVVRVHKINDYPKYR